MDVPLPPRLSQVLDAITDRELSLNLRRVIEAAAQAIDRLSMLNLQAAEPPLHEGSADLGLWERMARPISATVDDVNRLLQVIHTEFPEVRREAATQENASDDRSAAEAGMVFRAVARRLEHGVTQVGGMMRNPELVSSGWALIGELQRLRTEFRGHIGDAVYLAASACDHVEREEVVPGFSKELERAALFRRTAADVRRSVEAKLDDATTAPASLAKQVDGHFEIFSTMPAWRHVRTAAKRQVMLLREQLQLAAEQGTFTKTGLRTLVEPALALLRELADEQTQKLLATHDRRTQVLVGQVLELGRLHLDLRTGMAAAAFGRALAACEGLAGRERDFDRYLRRTRPKGRSALTDDEVHAQVEELKTRLASLRI